MKVHVTVSLDADLVQYAKDKNINMSRALSAFLENLRAGSEMSELKPPGTPAAPAKTVVPSKPLGSPPKAAEVQVQLAQETINRYRRYYRSTKWKDKEQREKWLNASAEILGVTKDRLIELLEEGARRKDT